jgi:CDP-diacylglycerol---serine O-phosphatidyltransferase
VSNAPDEPLRRRPGLTYRAILPNMVTALALCFGLTGIRFAFSALGAPLDSGLWEKAIGAIIIAGLLDGMDGTIARMLKGESRFGAELDSLSDVIAFGVSPALITYLWSLQHAPRLGWLCALAYAVCCALRLARFNARIDVQDQPHKSAGFLTGVPAPAGAGLVFLPLYLWIVTGNDWFRSPALVGPWLLFVALLMISNVATFSWGSIRLRRHVRLEAILLAALIGTALFAEPWFTLIGIVAAYLATLPFSIMSYARVKRARLASSGERQG